MTVKELRDKLQAFDGSLRVMVHREDAETHLFEIGDVSTHRGHMRRREDGTVGLTYDTTGAEYVFITAEYLSEDGGHTLTQYRIF
jgi:hypothetical protein